MHLSMSPGGYAHRADPFLSNYPLRKGLWKSKRQSLQAEHRRNALLGWSAEFVACLVLPASAAIGMAYFLAKQQDSIAAGDMIIKRTISEEEDKGTVEEEFGAEEETYILGIPVKCDVGYVGDLEQRTFFVQRVLGEESKMLTVKLERPAGIVFEQEEAGENWIRVVALLEGSNAERKQRLSKLTQRMDSAPQVGDILRGFTTTLTMYGTESLSGLSLPKRQVQFVAVDDLGRWEEVKDRMRRGVQRDGPVVFALERPPPAPQAPPPPPPPAA